MFLLCKFTSFFQLEDVLPKRNAITIKEITLVKSAVVVFLYYHHHSRPIINSGMQLKTLMFVVTYSALLPLPPWTKILMQPEEVL